MRWVELRPRISQGWCLPTSGQSWVLGSGYRAQGYQSLGQTIGGWGQGPVHLRACAGLLMGEQDLQTVGLWFPGADINPLVGMGVLNPRTGLLAGGSGSQSLWLQSFGDRRSSACTDVWGLVLGSLVDRVVSRGDYVLRGS